MLTRRHQPIGRRALLGGAALLGAAPALGAMTSPARAATLQGSLPRRRDVVVVGAGISGLVTARRLAEAGLDVLAVEARDRVGGRVLNHHLATGGVVESGGAFIGPTQGHIARLAHSLGVATFAEHTAGRSVYVSSLLGRLEYQGTVPPDPLVAESALLLARMNRMAAEIRVDAPWSHPRASTWDATTLGAWVRANTLSSGQILKLLQCWTEPTFGADPDELSLLFVLHYVACSGDEQHVGTFERNSEVAGAAQERRFVGGSQLVPLRLADQLGDAVALAAPVRRIEQGPDAVLVHTDRGSVSARRVVVACPPPQVLDIDWAPQLPDPRRQLLARMDLGSLMKCDAVYDRPFWRDAGLNGFGLNDSGAVRVAFDNCGPEGAPAVLLAFVGGDTWRRYGLQTLTERRGHVLEGFAALFGEQARHPVEYVEHDWTQEQWTRGGPVSVMAPGTLSRFGSAIRTPLDRVHWAGTETSTYWTGYMDGAVRAGERAAAEVLALPAATDLRERA